MSVTSTSREELGRLGELLRAAGDLSCADRVERALAGSEAELDAFLVSNELWGGSGSIADQGGLETPDRARIESALIALGQRQLREGRVNIRTQMWVEAFGRWRPGDRGRLDG